MQVIELAIHSKEIAQGILHPQCLVDEIPPCLPQGPNHIILVCNLLAENPIRPHKGLQFLMSVLQLRDTLGQSFDFLLLRKNRGLRPLVNLGPPLDSRGNLGSHKVV